MIRLQVALLPLAALLAAIVVAACGQPDGTDPGVTIELLPTQTATPLLGGKPAAPRATARPAVVSPEPTDEPPPAPSATPPAPIVQQAPAEGRWIDVDVTAFVVRLMDGENVLQEIAPVAVGEQVDTGEYLSTQTGLFYVHNKVEALAYDAPYHTYISHWVGFDPEKDNGFHSFLKDASGAVVDASTGRVSNGCIRTGDPEAIYAFAEIGMPVWVHE